VKKKKEGGRILLDGEEKRLGKRGKGEAPSSAGRGTKGSHLERERGVS